jgi:hypothetical protein
MSDDSMANVSSDEDSLPSFKRIRSDVQHEIDPSPDMGKMDAQVMDASALTRVTRRERALILKKFRQEQRLERRRYKKMVRAMWEEELANKMNRHEEDKENEQGSSSAPPVELGVEEEAFDNYLFDRMMQHDSDAARLLVHFRGSLTVIPETLSVDRVEDPNLRTNRTEALWAGLRRVYFGETEQAPPDIPERELTREEVVENLRKEIERLVEQLGRRNRPVDLGRPLPPYRDDDEDMPPPSLGHTNVVPDPRSNWFHCPDVCARNPSTR